MPAPSSSSAIASSPSLAVPPNAVAAANANFTSVGLAWAISMGIVVCLGALLVCSCRWARLRQRRRIERFRALQRQREGNMDNERDMMRSLNNLRDMTAIPKETILPIAGIKREGTQADSASSTTAIKQLSPATSALMKGMRANRQVFVAFSQAGVRAWKREHCVTSRRVLKATSENVKHFSSATSIALAKGLRVGGRAMVTTSRRVFRASSENAKQLSQATSTALARGMSTSGRAIDKTSRRTFQASKENAKQLSVLSSIALAKGMFASQQALEHSLRSIKSSRLALQKCSDNVEQLCHQAGHEVLDAMQSLNNLPMPLFRVPNVKWPVLPNIWTSQRTATFATPPQLVSLNDAVTIKYVSRSWAQRKQLCDGETQSQHQGRVPLATLGHSLSFVYHRVTQPVLPRLVRAETANPHVGIVSMTEIEGCAATASTYCETKDADVEHQIEGRRTNCSLRSPLTELAQISKDSEDDCVSAQVDVSFASSVSVPWTAGLDVPSASAGEAEGSPTPSSQLEPSMDRSIRPSESVHDRTLSATCIAQPEPARQTPLVSSTSSRNIVRGNTTLTIRDSMLCKDLPPTPLPSSSSSHYAQSSFIEMGVDVENESPSRMITPFSRREARRKHRRTRSVADVDVGQLVASPSSKFGSVSTRRPMSALCENTSVTAVTSSPARTQ